MPDSSTLAGPARTTLFTSGDTRLVWLDLVRGVGIILVVVGHTIDGLAGSIPAGSEASLGEGSLPGRYLAAHRAIYTFHMPLFFFLSGLVFLPSIDKRTLSESFSRRVITILWPYLLWSYLFIGMKFALAPMVNNPVTLTEFIYAPWPPKEHMWFLSSLFAIQVLALPLMYAGRYAVPVAAGVGFVFLALTTARVFAGTPEFIRETAAVVPFFLIGILYCGLNTTAPRRLSAVLVYVSVFLAAEVVFFAASADARPHLRPLVALTGVLCVTQVLRWFATRWGTSWLGSGLAMLGRLSMAIYLAHVLFSAATRILLERLGVQSVDLQILIGTLAGLAGPVVMYLVLKRFRLTRLFGVGV